MESNINTKISEIIKGCGNPEINSKTGNINIACGDSLDERYNRETGDLEFHNWLCPSCQAKLSATKETCLMMIDDEIEFLKEEYKFMKEIRNFGDSYNFFVGRLRIIELRLSAIQKLRSELE